MKEIELNKGYFTQVDDDDYDFLIQWKWRVNIKKHTCYVYRNTRIGGRKGRSITIHIHRLIMHTPPDLVIDHKDHNGLNNQKSNLRNCTRQQNQRNQTGRGVSKYLGVTYDKDRHVWRANIKIDKDKKWMGRFPTEIEAAVAYDQKAIIYFGEFAHLNFPK